MRTAIVIGLALCLAAAPLTPTRAAGPNASAELYELGMSQFEAGQYDEALVTWKRAFVLIRPDDDAQQATRAALVVGIVAAHHHAYELGHNPEHFAEAMRVIDLRKGELVQLYSQDQDALEELIDLNKLRAKIADLYVAALRKREVPQALPAGTAFHIESTPPHELNRKQLDMVTAADPRFALKFRRAKGMTDVGIIWLSIGGGVTLAAVAVFAAMYTPPSERSDGTLDPTPIVGGLGAAAGGAFIIGGTLLGVGLARKKQAREGYRARQSATGMVVPISLGRGGGLGFVGRF